MLEIKSPQHYYVHSSASTSDSDDDTCNKQGELNRNKKLKNELCRNFLNTGFCRYYDKCQFAHGIDQLRQSQKSNLKYKTKQCQSFFVKGCCQYGERCNFLHRQRDQDNTEYKEDHIVEDKKKEMRENFIQVMSPQSRLLRILKE